MWVVSLMVYLPFGASVLHVVVRPVTYGLKKWPFIGTQVIFLYRKNLKVCTCTREKNCFVNTTWRPTRILLVKAPSGKEAWTRGTVVLLRIPPSGPIWLLSCLIRETTAKYCGKSLVMILQIRFFPNSSGLSSSEKTNEGKSHENKPISTTPWDKLVCNFDS